MIYYFYYYLLTLLSELVLSYSSKILWHSELYWKSIFITEFSNSICIFHIMEFTGPYMMHNYHWLLIISRVRVAVFQLLPLYNNVCMYKCITMFWQPSVMLYICICLIVLIITLVFAPGMSEEAIMELNLPTGIPILYELDKNLKPVKPMQFLGDEETVRKAMEAVAAQGKAKK